MVNRRMCFRRLGHFVAGVLGIFYFGVDMIKEIGNGIKIKQAPPVKGEPAALFTKEFYCALERACATASRKPSEVMVAPEAPSISAELAAMAS